ncbi:hypothetical protein ACAH01_01750 [Halomicrobium sp. HM KBTZ05]|uniref:hypothetical protein n=1 Tax=Halomicrobium sp. HM KBTZ05 TaxID=3242663 RepID=UPI0035581AAB
MIEEISLDLQNNPIQYGNEDPLVPEIVHRLRRRLDPEYLPVEYLQDYGDTDGEWRVRDFWERVEEIGKACRVRPEVSFVEDGERWTYDRKVNGSNKSSRPKFDIAVFDTEGPMIGQSKQEGPGNYWDTENELSILCEIKHSKNETSNFYSSSKGADDIEALAQYPGIVERRVFLFIDWWPIDGNGNHRFQQHKERLLDNVGETVVPVDVIYLSRAGDHHEFTI